MVLQRSYRPCAASCGFDTDIINKLNDIFMSAVSFSLIPNISPNAPSIPNLCKAPSPLPTPPPHQYHYSSQPSLCINNTPPPTTLLMIIPSLHHAASHLILFIHLSPLLLFMQHPSFSSYSSPLSLHAAVLLLFMQHPSFSSCSMKRMTYETV